MKLIVGLGNPGFLYARNRHNVGFMAVGHLGRALDIKFDRKQAQARTGIGSVGGHRAVLARPQTFMNSSGESVGPLMRRLSVKPADLVVIYDDMDLPLGKIRLRLGGSSGGHKGVESIIARTGTRDFYRVRVGIGHPEKDSSAEKDGAVVSYVLSDFTPEERKVIESILPTISDAIMSLISEGLEIAMNKFN